MINNHNLLVTRDSVLLMFKLTPSQLRQLLKALHCQTYRLETRLYIRRDVNRLLIKLLGSRYANTAMQDYIDALEATTFLYRCTNCDELLFYPDIQLGEQLSHPCLLTHRPRHKGAGTLELIGSGPLHKLVDRHRRLFPLQEIQLPLEHPLSA